MSSPINFILKYQLHILFMHVFRTIWKTRRSLSSFLGKMHALLCAYYEKKCSCSQKPFTLYFISRFYVPRPVQVIVRTSKSCNVNSDSCGYEQLYKLLHFLTLCKQGKGLTIFSKNTTTEKLNKIFPFLSKKESTLFLR